MLCRIYFFLVHGRRPLAKAALSVPARPLPFASVGGFQSLSEGRPGARLSVCCFAACGRYGGLACGGGGPYLSVAEAVMFQVAGRCRSALPQKLLSHR